MTELEELQKLNTAFSDFVTYEKNRDTAADAAAAAAATAAETAATEKAAADALAADAAAAEHAADETELAAYRQSVLDALAALDGEPATQIDYTSLLTEIKQSITPAAEQSSVEYYADLSIIVFVVGVVPIILVWYLIKMVFSMLTRAF